MQACEFIAEQETVPQSRASRLHYLRPQNGFKFLLDNYQHPVQFQPRYQWRKLERRQAAIQQGVQSPLQRQLRVEGIGKIDITGK